MRRIIAGRNVNEKTIHNMNNIHVRRGVACILAASLCLASVFVGGGRKGAGLTASAVGQLSQDQVWEYEKVSSERIKISGYKGTDTQLRIPETIQDSKGVELDVTGIANYAFYKCDNLTSIEIPKSVVNIGEGILMECGNIREITVSEENTNYDSRGGCNAIIEKATDKLVAGCQSSQIPDDVKIIGKCAFTGSAKLENVTFPAGLTTIEEEAFSGCSGITRIEIPASVTRLDSTAFIGCSLEEIKVDEGNTLYSSGDNCNAIFVTTTKYLVVGSSKTTIPEGITAIYTSAFQGRKGLESIRIPSTVSWFYAYAFADCPDLQQIDFAKGCSVTTINSFAFRDCKSLKSISIPSGITEVGMYTFHGCSSLERVQLPEGVTSLGDRAFGDCSSLRELNFPESLTSIAQFAFYGCGSLPAVKIPSAMTELGAGIFSGCASLTEIEIPSGITKIGNGTFSGCASLTRVEIPAGVTELGKEVFSECSGLTRVDFSGGITTIPELTFYSCVSLAEVSFPSTLTEIEGRAFWNCESLTRLEIPEGVTKLGKNMFYGATNLKEITLPDTLQTIGEEAFVGTGLESLRIPKNVTSIGDGLFNGEGDTPEDCFTSIRQITVDEENKTYDSREGSNAIIETKTDTLLYGSNTTTKIPEGVKKIGRYAFSGCKDLESIEFSSTVNEIAGHIFTKCNGLSRITVAEGNSTYSNREGCNAVFQGSKLVVGCKDTKIPRDVSSLEIAAFSGCTALTGIELPSGLKEIPDMAFMWCSGLKSIRIPNGVTRIGLYGFHYCASLEHVYIPSSVETFDGFNYEMRNVFLGCPKLTIHTTAGAKAVEFAEKFDIPYTFDPMPEEPKSPQETLAPGETVAPQRTLAPGETVTPQRTLAPGETVAPQRTLAPGETVTPQRTSAPGGTVAPKETVKPTASKPAGSSIKKPGKPKIKKLKNKSGKKVTVTLSKKVAGATGYQVAYAVKSSMKGQKKKSFKGTSVTVKGLKKKKTYYFRVRAYVKKNGKTVYGSWGNKKKIKIKK